MKVSELIEILYLYPLDGEILILNEYTGNYVNFHITQEELHGSIKGNYFTDDYGWKQDIRDSVRYNIERYIKDESEVCAIIEAE